jgi:hypothetical protein
MEILFLILLWVLLYVFFLFPAILMLITWLPRKMQRGGFEPSVAVLIAARNERENIGPKIVNTLACDYPREKLRILVGSDGSSDGPMPRSLRPTGPGCAWSRSRPAREKHAPSTRWPGKRSPTCW